ncbi:MAG: lamin tail domain-containing protein [Bacteroidota bacterium]
MKKNLSIFFFFPLFLSAQVKDDFNDGDFISNPTWSGDNTKWEILIGQLHSIDSIANNIFYISTPSSRATNAQWEFCVNLKFNTSSLNYVDIFLTSDSANLKSTNNNGYFVRVGNTLDEICLYRKNGGVITKIIDGTDGTLNTSNNIVKTKVTRNSVNMWKLERDITGTGNNYFTEGTTTDATFNTSNYFGVLVKQSTSSFFGKHYFDDFYAGQIIVDTISPKIDSLVVLSQNQLDVYFSETVDTTSANTETNYFVNNGIGNSFIALRDAGNFSLVHLSFTNNFIHKMYHTLTVMNVQDMSANTIVSAVDSFLYYVPQIHDVVINEIMSDINPIPPVLPAYEYLELYNRTNFPINLNGWKLSDATSTITLPNITILPDSFYILTSVAGASAFGINISVVGIQSFLSLNDAGDNMILRDVSGNIISFAFYTTDWYHDVVKQNGGWALEQIDPNNFCGGTNNWKASVNVKGGTPGIKNSVYASNPDVTAPKLIHATVITSNMIQLFFNEIMDSISLMNFSAYTIDNIGNPTKVNFVGPNYMSVLLFLPTPILSGTIYTVTLNSNVKDCAGNSIYNINTAKFAIAQSSSANDIIINEVLFDPKTNGVEWVEIYNRSAKVIDLKELYLCSQDDAGVFTDITQIAPEGYLIFPQDYFVLSTDDSKIKNQYSAPNMEGFINMTSIPPLNNDSDHVFIINQSQTIIDKLFYHSKWHLPLLNDTKGISLERINFDNLTQNETNWHSAAESMGGATPAYKNSQYTNEETGTEVTVSPKIFSPDNDGNNDVLSINYLFDTPGMVGNVNIYDSRGRLVRTLIRNELLATSGFFFWDGITNDRQKANIGIYIVYFEAFSTKGNVKKYKMTCVVAEKH